MGLPLLLWLVCCHVAPQAEPRCPVEMAPIGTGPGSFCLDRWEAQIVDPLGNPMALVPHDGKTPPASRSVADVLPTINISFEDAMLACAQTDAVVGGQVVGRKHLATEQEWLDGADGLLGPGGRRWPWGELEDATRCNLRARGASSLERTGSSPRCVSVEGVYDLVGNAFEWVDAGLVTDIAGTLRRFATEGVDVTVAADDALVVPPDAPLARLDSNAAAIRQGTLRRDEGGNLRMEHDASLPDPKGFLRLRAENQRDPTTMLPVRFVPQEESGEAQLFLWAEGDGRPIPVKIGGSWYSEGAWPDPQANHTSDFCATIAFRCAFSAW